MQKPLQIVSRDFALTEAIETAINKKVQKLDAQFPSIIGIRVVIELPEKHRNKGNNFNVRLDITAKGKELVVQRQPHIDLTAAIRESFDAAHRLLAEHEDKLRVSVKTHDEVPGATIKALYPEEDYGFLITADGTEVYFHRNAVLKGEFDKLEVGDKVRYVETMGEKGPQASTVELGA